MPQQPLREDKTPTLQFFNTDFKISAYIKLKIPRDATAEQIATAFEKGASITHPSQQNPKYTDGKAYDIILRAYTILSNPHTRKQYDQELIRFELLQATTPFEPVRP